MVTCFRRNDALHALRVWVEAKLTRKNVRPAEMKLLKAAIEYEARR